MILLFFVSKKPEGQVPLLKSAVERVAAREGVDVGALANYMAYRLALQGVTNWWGTATNLQPRGADPWAIARDMLIQNIDFSKLGPPDEDLLRNALSE